MAYVLQELLNIRDLRDNSAEQSLKREQNRYEQALRAIDDRKRELEEYIQWRLHQENERYTSMMKKRLLVARLEEARMDIALLREADLMKQQKVLDAETAAEKARTDLEQARLVRAAAQKDLQKIEEHRDIWIEEWAKERALLEDREAEELLHQRLEFGDDEADDDEKDFSAAREDND